MFHICECVGMPNVVVAGISASQSMSLCRLLCVCPGAMYGTLKHIVASVVAGGPSRNGALTVGRIRLPNATQGVLAHDAVQPSNLRSFIVVIAIGYRHAGGAATQRPLRPAHRLQLMVITEESVARRPPTGSRKRQASRAAGSQSAVLALTHPPTLADCDAVPRPP